MSPEQFILDAHKVTDRFGKWPDFHDAEIVRLHLDRGGPSGPTLEFTLFGWGWNGIVLPSGLYDRANLSLVHFRCDGLEEDNEFGGFNHQNVLRSLRFERIGELIQVEMSPSFGIGGQFTCRSVRVIDVLEASEYGQPAGEK